MWKKRVKPDEQRERVIKDREKARERTMNRAVKLLAARPRSVGELRERLLEKTWTDEKIVDAVIDRLKEYGYLDDAQYARDTAMSKLRQRPQGRRRLQYSMSQKKLDRETVDSAIDSAFEKLPESDLIKVAIEKYIRIKGQPETREGKKKLFDYLLRRGFEYELIREKMTGLTSLDADE